MNGGHAAAITSLDLRAKYSIVSLALVLLLFAAVFAILFLNPLMVAPEVALNLEAAELIAAGKTPYTDFFSMSSPLSLYSSLLPVFAAGVCGLPVSLTSSLLAWALALASVLGSAVILLPRRYHREWHYFPLFIIAYAVVNVIMLFQIGQREHLVMLAAVPFFLIRWLRWNGHNVSRSQSIVCGILAGLAVGLWHEFSLVILSLECYWLVSLRRFRPLLALEARVALCVLAACLLGFLVLPEAARTAYFTLIYPLQSLGYQCHDWSIYGRGSVPERRDVFYAAIASILFTLPFAGRASLSGPLVVLFLVGFGLYMSQLKGLSQSCLVMIFATTLLFGINLGTVGALVHKARRKLFGASAHRAASIKAPNINSSWFTSSAIALLVVGVIGGAAAYLQSQAGRIGLGSNTNSPITKVIAGDTENPSSCASWLAEYSKENDEILFLTDGLQPGYPLMMQMKRRPSGYMLQTDCLIELEACERESLQPKTFENYAEQLYSRIKQDIASKRAKMIFVQDVTIDDLLKKHKVAEVLLANYELKGHTRLKGVNQEPTEHAGFNYNIAVYLPKRQVP